MTKTKNVINITSLVIVVLIVSIIISGLVDIVVNWTGANIGTGIVDSFKRLGDAFNVSLWSSLTGFAFICSILTVFSLCIGTIILIGVTIVTIIRKTIFGIIPIVITLATTLSVSLFIANFDAIHNVAILNGGALSIVLYILVLLVVIGLAGLVTLLLKYIFASSMARESVIEKEVSREIIIEETETTISPSMPQTIIINNNYYGEETEIKEETPAVVPPSAFGLGKKKPRPPFALKLRRGGDHIRDMYNEIKAEFLSYGLNSRISLNGDAFRLHAKTYAIIQAVGKSLRINYALNCKDYESSTIPFADSSKQKKYEEVPFTFKTRSNLSIKRAKELIRDAVTKDGITQDHEPVQKNYAREAIETLKTSQYYLKNFARK